MIDPNKHPSQAQTLKLHMNLCNNHHHDRMTTLQGLRLTILLPKLFRKTNLVFLEEAKTTYALILTLITQKYTNIDMCKRLIQLLFVSHPYSLPFLFSFFRTRFIQIFSFSFLSGAYTYTPITSTETNRTIQKCSYTSYLQTSPLAPAPEERSYEEQVLAATALEILLKSMRGLRAGRFLCGISCSGLPEDKVTSASVPTLVATLTSL